MKAPHRPAYRSVESLFFNAYLKLHGFAPVNQFRLIDWSVTLVQRMDRLPHYAPGS